MPSEQEVRWSQLKIGVLVLVSLTALTALIFLMSGGIGGLFGGKITLRSYFENASGLRVGAPVNLEGVTVGNVRAIQIVPERKLTPVEVIMRINGGYRRAVHSDSKAGLDTVGVLGDTVVDIHSKDAVGPLVENNAELPTNETPNLSDVIKSSQGTIDQLNLILAKANSIADALTSNKGSVGKLINDPDLYNRAVITLTQIQQLVDEVSNGKGSVGKLLKDETLYNHLNSSVTRLDDLTAKISEGKGTIGQLLNNPALANNLNSSAANANRLLEDINAGKGGLGMIAQDPQFAAKLRETVDRLDSIMGKVDSGQGTIGELIANPTFYNNSNQLLTNLQGLVTAIRENPKKYLMFRVRLF